MGDDWVGKYDYLEELGVKVFYFPYGKGISSSNVKTKILNNYARIKSRTEKLRKPDIKKSK